MRQVTILCILCFHLAGCANFKPAVIPGNEVGHQQNNDPQLLISEGDIARITMNSGQLFTGKVLSISAADIVLATSDTSQEFDSNKVVVLTRDIDKIELDTGSHVAGFTSVTIGLALIAMALSFKVATNNN